MRIRIAEKEDLPGIVMIYNQAVAIRGATADTEPHTLADQRQWFAGHPPHQYPVWVAEDMTGEDMAGIVGWCSLTPYRPGRRALIHTVEISYYVHQSWRRKGIGTALIQYALAQCADLNIKTLFALLLDCNRASINILKKFGFAEWGYMPNVAEIDGKEYGHLIYGKRVGS